MGEGGAERSRFGHSAGKWFLLALCAPFRGGWAKACIGICPVWVSSRRPPGNPGVVKACTPRTAPHPGRSAGRFHDSVCPLEQGAATQALSDVSPHVL